MTNEVLGKGKSMKLREDAPHMPPCTTVGKRYEILDVRVGAGNSGICYIILNDEGHKCEVPYSMARPAHS